MCRGLRRSVGNEIEYKTKQIDVTLSVRPRGCGTDIEDHHRGKICAESRTAFSGARIVNERLPAIVRDDALRVVRPENPMRRQSREVCDNPVRNAGC
jgi:hypothetical protein